MTGAVKLEYSPHQASALEALLSRQKTSQTPENNPQPETLQTNLPEDNTELINVAGGDRFNDDSE